MHNLARVGKRWLSSGGAGARRAGSALRILVVDGYGQESRDTFDEIGMPQASTLYSDALTRSAPAGVAVERHVVYPCMEGFVPPTDEEMSSFDGAAFTGSSYSAYSLDDDVTRQIELMRRTFENGVPCFGSCWGIQMATMALGGVVELNPRGREAGVGHKIALTAEGRDHPMFAGKKSVFSAWMSHSDEVTVLPKGAVLTASNEHSHVQAMAVTAHGTESWFVQYHPEYDLNYIAALLLLRKERMVSLGFFRDEEDAERYIGELRTLRDDPARRDIAWRYGIDEDLVDDGVKQRELANWLEHIAALNK
jgi:GMP synthase (glutamine-hydrolysing)